MAAGYARRFGPRLQHGGPRWVGRGVKRRSSTASIRRRRKPTTCSSNSAASSASAARSSRPRVGDLRERGSLTRPGKQAISEEKLSRVRELLAKRFALSCGDCTAVVRKLRPEAELLVVADERCEHRGGSDHRGAALRFIAACQGARVRRVLIVGGNPTSRQALTRHLENLDVQLIDGTGGLSATRARQLMDWADLVLIWGKTQLAHRVSTHFTSAQDRKVVTAAKRGIGGLLDAGTRHLEHNESR